MLIRSIAFLFLFAASATASDCTGNDLSDALTGDQRLRLEAITQSHPYAEGLLWKAKRGATEITIFGTMHTPDPAIDTLLPDVSPYLLAADLAVFENTPSDLKRFEQKVAGDPDIVYNNTGPTLPESLSEDDWQTLSAALKERGVPPFLASKMWPWLVSITLAIPVCLTDDIRDKRKGIDQQLMQIAENAGIRLQALDEWDVVLKIFATMPLEKQLDMLRWSLPELRLGDDLVGSIQHRGFSVLWLVCTTIKTINRFLFQGEHRPQSNLKNWGRCQITSRLIHFMSPAAIFI